MGLSSYVENPLLLLYQLQHIYGIVSWMLVGMLLLCFLISVKPLILFLIYRDLVDKLCHIQLQPNNYLPIILENYAECGG